MNSRKTIEIVRTALELVVEQGRFSTTELINRIDCPVSNSEVQTVLLHLQDVEWIEKSGEEPPMWVRGQYGSEYLDSSSTDQNVFRVLPDEVPDDEPFR